MQEAKAQTRNAMIKPLAVLPVVLLGMAAFLRWQGRIWWCAGGGSNLWVSDIWSGCCSQHLLDPYSFTHVLHGVAFCVILAFFLPRLAESRRFVLAISLEALWEIVENSEFIIQRYREVTISLGYTGDSIINSLGDVACCALGFLIARKIGWKWSIALFLLTETVLILWIRDSLLLNILMLLCPIEGIKQWQMAH